MMMSDAIRATSYLFHWAQHMLLEPSSCRRLDVWSAGMQHSTAVGTSSLSFQLIGVIHLLIMFYETTVDLSAGC